MSSINEDSDGTRATKVIRRSSRLGSTESLNDLENRADTPTVRNVKKLGTISENVVTPTTTATPTKKTKTVPESPKTRRTRQISEPEAPSSPFRRLTRRTSQDQDNPIASPLPTRNTRRSGNLGSDSEEVQASTPIVKGPRKKRQSNIVEQITEEPEEFEDALEENIGDRNEKSTPQKELDELELRNRSITKSPNSTSSPVGRGSPVVVSTKLPDALELMDQSLKEKLVKKIFKSRNGASLNKSQNGSRLTYPDEDISESSSELPPIEKYERKGKSRAEHAETTYQDVMQKIAKKSTLTKPTDTLNESKVEQIDVSQKSDNIEDIVESSQTVENTSVRGRRSIHSETSQDAEEQATILMEDFIDEVGNEMKSPKNTSKKSLSIIQATPKSDKKTPKASKETPKSDKKTPKMVEGTPKSSKKNPQSEGKNGKETPQSVEKSAKKTSKGVEDVIGTFVKTPKRLSKTAAVDMDISKSGSDVEVIDATPPKSGKRKSLNRIETDHHSVDMVVEKLSNVATPPKSGKRKSLNRVETDLNNVDIVVETLSNGASKAISPQLKEGTVPKLLDYIDNVSELAKKRRESLKAEAMQDDKLEQKSPKKHSISWSQSVVKTNTSEELPSKRYSEGVKNVVSSPIQPRKFSFVDSDSETDDEGEKNPFVDDEAEVGSEGESITESERKYIDDNEIPENGEDIGSEDSCEMELGGEEEEESDDSFIVGDDDVSDQYSMDSQEEEQESHSPVMEKSKRRISRALDSSSDDDEPEKEKEESPSKAELSKSLRKSEIKAITEENGGSESADIQAQPIVKTNSKRKRETNNESFVKTTKKAKIDANESEALHMDDVSGVAGLFEEDSGTEPAQVEKKVKTKKITAEPTVAIEKVISKCDEIMGVFNEEKRAKLAIKRDKKAKKLLKKEAEKAAAAENLDSSNGENKENSLKKKKKKSQKKQKSVDDAPDKKEDMATAVSKIQEKLERKRLKKNEKKLARQQQESLEVLDEKSSAEIDSPVEIAKKRVKEPKNSVVEEIPVEKKSKKQKAKKAVVETEEVEITEVTEVEPPVDKVPKKKKHNKSENVVEQPVEAEKKIKKKAKELDAPIATENVAEPSKKNKKKRKLEETEFEDEEKPQAKKKLNILKQIENPSQYQSQHVEPANSKSVEPQFSIPLPSQKLKKVLPQSVAAQQKRKKKSKGKRVIPEPPVSLPRPVWTSSGVFLEQPATPYKFKSTDYIPIQAVGSSSTKFGVVLFEAKKSKKPAAAEPAPQDFKTQAIFRNKKQRDGSMKNIRGLLRTQSTF